MAGLPAEVAVRASVPDQSVVSQESRLFFAGSLSWNASNTRVEFAALISDSRVSLFLQPPETMTVKDVANWTVGQFSSSMRVEDRQDASMMEGSFMDVLGDIAKSIVPRQLSLAIVAGSALTPFQIDVELRLNFGARDKHVPIHGQVKWEPGHLELLGEIWHIDDQNPVPLSIHPFREAFSEISPDTTN
ncbi:hypothetical protein CSHISOI_03232 [Colletotrichum shisoi]|uniref:Uncharacterized protein n=1 Tax=Colletotrichum shisoi TaxID=2078593 RepID=A0A5Q4BZ18_9PEZI|nr:hypothetical protein CSHISOI_03232 [Colletotrichum shisoi]